MSDLQEYIENTALPAFPEPREFWLETLSVLYYHPSDCETPEGALKAGIVNALDTESDWGVQFPDDVFESFAMSEYLSMGHDQR